jgi:hypothetical protein
VWCRYIPQEVLNDDFRALDRADMFMLGASLYELATGTHLPSGRLPSLKLLRLWWCNAPARTGQVRMRGCVAWVQVAALTRRSGRAS